MLEEKKDDDGEDSDGFETDEDVNIYDLLLGQSSGSAHGNLVQSLDSDSESSHLRSDGSEDTDSDYFSGDDEESGEPTDEETEGDIHPTESEQSSSGIQNELASTKKPTESNTSKPNLP